MEDKRLLLLSIGRELCNCIFEKTSRGEDDRFEPDDLPVIFVSACVHAIRKSSDPSKAARDIAEVLDEMLHSNKDSVQQTVVQ